MLIHYFEFRKRIPNEDYRRILSLEFKFKRKKSTIN